MNNVFELPHIFVVFHPGAAGNFMTNLIRNILNEGVNVQVSSIGSCHDDSSASKLAFEYFSCGIFYPEQYKIKPHSFDNRVQFYKNKLLSLTQPITSPVVTWTHDFTNIPLYRKLFPNCKILVITQETIDEKLIITAMQQLKNILAKDLISMIPAETKNWFFNIWKDSCRVKISELTNDTSFIEKMLDDRFNDAYRDIIEYASIFSMLDRYGLTPAIDDLPTEDRVNYVAYYGAVVKSSKPLIIVKSYNECIDNDCILLPYSSIIHNNNDRVIEQLYYLIGNLSDTQKNTITFKLNQYVDGQPKSLVSSPLQYLRQLRDKALIFNFR
jgi:hypothetical protein